MSFRLVARPEVELEILDVAEHYERQKPGLGIEFLEELEEAKTKLSESPQFYFNIAPEGSLRRYLLEKFPYKLIYKIEGDEVVVIAVRHQRQKPL